jgi:putative heme-binding domain-containing protein
MQIAVLGGIGQGLASQRSSLAALAAAPEHKEVAAVLEKIFAVAQKRAANQNLDEAERVEAIALLAYHPSSSDELLALVDGEPIQAVKIKAIAALARHPGLEAWTDLLGRFGSQSPAVRRAILDGVLADGRRIALLLDQMEQGAIKPSELDPVQTNRLTSNRDPAIKKRVAQLIAQQTPADRAKALADYQPALAKEGDPLRGRMVFEKNCSTCHKVGGVGVNVAPDISDTRTKKPSQLLADILQPNRAIDNNYVAYAVLLADGTAASGILSNETSTSITLRQPGDKTLVVSRDDIEELKSTGVSLMPEGLEKNIPLDAMADLLAFLKNWRYLDGKTPLGQ